MERGLVILFVNYFREYCRFCLYNMDKWGFFYVLKEYN